MFAASKRSTDPFGASKALERFLPASWTCSRGVSAYLMVIRVEAGPLTQLWERDVLHVHGPAEWVYRIACDLVLLDTEKFMYDVL